jgi:Predicted methyltransferase regulatory domain
VASAMADIKCDYIGSATLQDNFGGLTVPSGMVEMLEPIRDTGLRETMRDIAGAAQFRRDLWQRGARRMTAAEHRARVDAVRLARTFKPVPDPFVVPSALGPLNADPVRFPALLELLEPGPAIIGELRATERLRVWTEPGLMEAVALLAGGGYLTPVLPNPPGEAAKQATARLNAVHAAMFEQGYMQPYLAYPVLGGAWQTDGLEILALDELRRGRAADEQPLTDAVLHRVADGGRSLYQAGELLPGMAEVRDRVAGKVRELLGHLPAMRALGLSDAPSTATDAAARAETV